MRALGLEGRGQEIETMCAFSLSQRILSFTSPLGSNVLLPEYLSGTEGISELFCYKLDLLADVAKTIKPKDIVGKRVCIGIQANDAGTERFIHGMVSSFEMLNGDQELNCYRATIVPTMWMLTLTQNTRCYQQKTVTDVIKDVLSAYSISPTISTSNTYSPLEYCVQYRESDFNFISRLMEQHGIFYYFQHTSDDHTLVLQDTSSKLSDNPIQDSFKFRAEKGNFEGFYDFVISEISSRSTMVTGKFTGWDFSFKRYSSVEGTEKDTAGPLGANSNEAYDYSGATSYKVDATDTNLKTSEDFYNTVKRDASDAETQTLEGMSNAVCMQTGYAFTVTDHPITAVNEKYILVHAEHSVQQLPSYRTRTREAPQPFTNTFRAVPFSMVYRAPILTEKPVVYGLHTGQVVVPSGEESHMDKYGRVNVQFFWDRLRKASTPDNTWLRIAQSWASNGWGTYYWPRVNDEVLVGFMEGDPDQPIVMGSVYNGVNMPPYDPVGQYTLSGVVTRSSKGGGSSNANELRFEDLKGKEQIYVNAERDYDIHVEHDAHTQIDNEEHLTVKKNRFAEIDGDQHSLVKGKNLAEVDGDDHLNIKGKNVVQIGGDREHNVTGNLKEQFGQNQHITVGQNFNQSVGQNYSLTVGMKQAIQAGMNFDVTAPMQISLNCGPNSIVLSPEGIGLNGAAGFISIGPAGITISGVMVMINSGGAPVVGSPGSAQSPQAPGSATAPTAPSFPGDTPYSTASSPAAGSAGAAAVITDIPGAPPSAAGYVPPVPPGPPPPPSPLVSEPGLSMGMGMVPDVGQDAVKGAQAAAQQAQQAANQAQQAVQQAEQQAQQAVSQVTAEARQTYNQAQQAVQQAEQQVKQAAAQGQAAAQQALAQAQQQAQQAAQQAAAAVQDAQKQADQVKQQAQQAASQAQQAAQQAQQQVQQAAQQAQQAVNQGVKAAQGGVQQAQQAAQQAQQQAQQAAQQAQQAAQQAAAQAKQAAAQAEQQAQQAAGQVKQAASGAQQQAQQAAQGAQQSAQQAVNSAMHGF